VVLPNQKVVCTFKDKPFMENIFSEIVPKSEVTQLVEKVFHQRYNINSYMLATSLGILGDYLKHLSDDLTVIVEDPYVDKVYRNIYYHYYSSKLENYPRKCIKLAFFINSVKNEDFRDPSRLKYLQDNFGGFLVLRPTFPFIIGRSVLSPLITRTPSIDICSVSISTTIKGVKLEAIGFPHASQDSEMLTCAETTVWSQMEYFGNRYPENQPVLPDRISKVLSSISFERLIPSKGLSGNQISFAIKEFGFGVKGYSRSQYLTEFEPLLKTYVESGIPVVALMENNDKSIGHALNVIGREPFTPGDIENLHEMYKLKNDKPVLDFTTMPMRYVFIDDNFPPYQLAYIDAPATYYSDKKWKECSIKSFVVPLYPKIYLEADEARRMALLMLDTINFNNNDPIVLKTFLASSRSFKHSIAMNALLDNTAKELLLGTAMPKFIWVAEITNKELLAKDLCTGIIVLDATEPRKTGVIACMIENSYITLNVASISQAVLSLQPFKMYSLNLKYH
jgi:hypothetical protein